MNDSLPFPSIVSEQDISSDSKENLQRLLNVFLQAGPALFVIEPETGAVLFANKRARRRLGFSKQDMKYKRVVEWEDSFPDQKSWEKHVEELREQGEMLLDTKPRDAEGEPFVAQVHTKYVPTDDGDLIVVVSQDITKQKQREREFHEERKRLEKLSYRDALTGIPNRRELDARLERELARCRREGVPLSVLMLDIDHFKPYNDNYGHKKGDQCLIAVAEVIEETLKRPADEVARYGGEEFVVTLPDTNYQGAQRVAGNIRQAVAELAIPHETCPIGDVVTVSIGVSTTEIEEVMSSATLIKSADRALYKAKSNGRNCVCVQGIPD